jgi:glutamate dehydrogenase
MSALSRQDPAPRLVAEVDRAIGEAGHEARRGASWLHASVPALLGSTLREDAGIIAAVAGALPRLAHDSEVRLVDRPHDLVLLRLDRPGSVLETLRELGGREIAAAEILHSDTDVPGLDRALEVHRYAFATPPTPGAPGAAPSALPAEVAQAVHAAAETDHPSLTHAEIDETLALLWAQNERLVRLAPPREVARLVWLHRECRAREGFFLDLLEPDGPADAGEATVVFAVADPPARGFLMQIIEVFNALDIGTRRSLALTLDAEGQTWFVGSFHVAHRGGAPLERDGELFRRLRSEIFATQILAVDTPAWKDFVLGRLMTVEEAALLNAFIGFCHTTCAHGQAEQRYTFEDVVRAFHFHPEITLDLVRLFKLRFDPARPDREAAYAAELERVEKEVAAYATGHRMLDEFRRSLFEVALVLVKRTLKTNFFVEEKHALAFRLDPAYLDDLAPIFTADLPRERPFRVTFFFARAGLGYHIGFADIARGGWRTIFSHTRDDYVTVANTLFRENYVLAHTQHLKNKDIYEGGSKMVVVVHAAGRKTRPAQVQLLHKVQRAVANAFFDVFVTENGRARNPRVVDLYGEDEPIELGPDENMHDEMIETMARLSVRRGYALGAGVMSSKRVGINHKQYGVTSTGVVTFAEVAMRARGVDLRKDAFSLKLTGGPNGDVAGNALRLLLERCPGAEIRLIVDGTAALYDPRGLDHDALRAIVLSADADAFDPRRLSPGGFLLARSSRRTEGLRELYRRVEMTAGGLEEAWVTTDDFHAEYDGLLFDVPADLFIPAGGRPETIHEGNWRRLLGPDEKPNTPVIVEGANSFLTPAARVALQAAGVVVLRDAAANKCGVISSSYEIIANLLFSDEEFLARKEPYVRGVLAILERRAADEAELIFRRHREAGGRRSYTEISDAIAVEINAEKARLFRHFLARPGVALGEPWQRALLAHLPRLVRETPELRPRVARLPEKYQAAILAAEIATAMTYRRPMEPDFDAALRTYVQQTFE